MKRPETALNRFRNRQLPRIAATLLCATALGGANTAAAQPAATVDERQPLSRKAYPPVKIGHAAIVECGDPGIEAPLARQENALLCRINQARRIYQHAAPLTRVADLDQSALLKTQDEANCLPFTLETGLTISHFACNYPWNQHIPSAYYPAGENLGVGIGDGGSARMIMNGDEGFMLSETHRENILYPTYQYIGIAALRDGAIMRWTTHFGAIPTLAP
jgi:uncharacterized protein YkwD